MWRLYTSRLVSIFCHINHEYAYILINPVTDKTIKLWKVSERDKRPEGYNLKDEEGRLKDISTITSLQVHTQTKTDTHTPARAHFCSVSQYVSG